MQRKASEVDAAIALGTPDDFGGLNASGDFRETTEMRARQNVWLEVGWFWGRLGRGRVLILFRGDVAFPSDLSGIEAYKYSRRPSDRVLEIQGFVRRVSSGIRRPARLPSQPDLFVPQSGFEPAVKGPSVLGAWNSNVLNRTEFGSPSWTRCELLRPVSRRRL
jgi:hypothetical protein